MMYKFKKCIISSIAVIITVVQLSSIDTLAFNDAFLTKTVSREKNYAEVKSKYYSNKKCESIISVLKNSEGVLSLADSDELLCDFTCDEDGCYNLSVVYEVVSKTMANVVRGIKIDGETPFAEAKQISFPRYWSDDGEITKNTAGDEVRPSVKEIVNKYTYTVYDAGAFYETPLEFYISKGEHNISFSNVSGDIRIYEIRFEPVKTIPKYKELSLKYTKITEGNEEIVFQAESAMRFRSDSSIRMESNSDPAATPRSLGYKKLNVIGGYRWRQGGQSVMFDFKVEKSGYYKISLRYLQNWNDGLSSYRRIEIDGSVPCAELLSYKFNYDTTWQTETLSSDDEPMLFYFTSGEHRLTMTVTLGELTPIVKQTYDNMLIISDMIQSINQLTGKDADANYDYEFFKNIPTLKDDLTTVSVSLKNLADNLDKITSKTTSTSGNFRSISKQLDKMIQDPFSIAKKIEQLTSAQTNLGTYYSNLQLLPLMLDEISLTSPNILIKHKESNFFKKLYTSFYNFLISFYKNYNGVSGTVDENSDIYETLDVWVARGKEWTEAIKYLSDSKFTPQSKTLVNMNVVPSSQLNTGSSNALLLSIVSGNAPDIAMGVSANSPVEFAIRDAVCDISEFTDFGEISKRFLEKNFVPFRYNGGVYAIPETMNFTCLFYRKDIFKKYGYNLPNTWQDLYDDLLPQLYQNGMQFYMPQDFTIFLYQNGGEYYTSDGLKSALSSGRAYNAFKSYTEMFTNYASPVSANFLTRFRTGEMPIGVGSFAFYIQLCTAAPELVGNWEISLLPATVSDDGTLNRSSGGLASECDIILSKGKKSKTAWEFLKWWSSNEIQTEYAKELEASIGVEARWNSANIEAFSSLDWSSNDINVIKQTWEWANETPIVLGSYYTTRYVNNAFNSVVVSGNASVRDALEEAVEAINRELVSKQLEYGVIADD